MIIPSGNPKNQIAIAQPILILSPKLPGLGNWSGFQGPGYGIEGIIILLRFY